MNTVELFCGTKSFSKYFESIGHKTFTVDINESFNPSLVHDMLEEFPAILKEKIKDADVIWMSPPCQTLSMASGYKHWTVDKEPKTDDAKKGKSMIEVCKKIAKYCEENNKLYFIENPRARARWFLPKDTRKTVWYCRYGDNRAKPTDIWTNLSDWQGRQCKNGNKACHHEPAPRGSRSGTQGRKGAKERGEIPSELFEEIHKNIK